MEKEKKETEKTVNDEKALEENIKKDDVQAKAENASDGYQLINHQALQSQYVEKLEKLLLKEDITPHDIQNVEFCKAELLAQFLGTVSFSASLSNSDERKKAADALSSHLSKLYGKTAKLKEKLALKANNESVGKDVMEAKFSNKEYAVVTDEMMGYDIKKICLLVGTAFAAIVVDPKLRAAATDPKANMAMKMMNSKQAGSSKTKGSLFSLISEFVNSPEKRLNAQLPDLLKEFNQKTTDDEKNKFSNWANTLVTVLSKLVVNNSILNALQGKDLSKIMGNIFGSKDNS